MRAIRLRALASVAWIVASRAAAEDPDADLPEYEAVAVTPAPVAGADARTVPSHVQRVNREALDEERALGLHDALDARLGAVAVGDAQGNPLQVDLQYRGFTLSPLLGVPQGLAVYQNGVRLNEPFGDTLQWDLVPEFAVDDVQVAPGANPVYGLNALGGSLAFRMKNGFRFQKTRLRGLGGSFARHRSVVEHGQAFDDWALYGGMAFFGEEGWRDHSPSQAENMYADVRHRGRRHEVGLDLGVGTSELRGNGPAPVSLLAVDRAAVFTYPDITENRMLMLASDADVELAPDVSLQATAYVRHLGQDTVNGDEADFAPCSDPAGGMILVLCDEEGESIAGLAGEAIAGDVDFDALLNATATHAVGYGGSLQTTLDGPLAMRRNQFVAGASIDAAQVSFSQGAEAGTLRVDRGVTGGGPVLGGDEFRTDLGVTSHYLGLYATETWSFVDPLALTLSGRLNWARVELSDRLGSALDGAHDFVRLNPALGLTWQAASRTTVFTSYGESNRAPSAAELSCADPDEPCRVPNAFLSDPPLKQVVGRSVEVGVRGKVGARASRLAAFEWSAAAFGSRNADDIVFVAGSRVGTGYFRNAGTTQRIGAELELRGESGPVEWRVGYALVHATFESSLDLPGDAHPRAVGGAIRVEPGDRIPGVPRHNAKAGITLEPIARVRVGLTGIAHSSRFYRGDEGNLLDEVPGYVVLGAHGSYWPVNILELFFKVQNLANAEHETFGVLGDPSAVLGNSDPRFVGPGAPFGVWAGLTLETP